MAKIAAALPAIMAAATPQLLTSLALTAAAGGIDAYGRKRTQETQDAANNQWLQYQKRKENIARDQENKLSRKANSSLDEYLKEGTGDARKDVIQNEADRLGTEFERGLDEQSANTIAQNPGAGRSEVFDEALAKSVNEATASARQRMQALAKASAYGGSSGGMGMTDQTRQMNTGIGLGTINNQRAGNLSVLDRFRGVQPEQFSYRQSPLVPILQAGSAVVGGINPGDGAFGQSIFGKAAAAGSPAAGFRPIARPAGLGGAATMSTANAPRGAGSMLFQPAVATPGFSFMKV